MFIYFHQSPCTINFHNTERVRLSTNLPSEPSCCPASRSRRRRPPRSWTAADGCRARTCRCRRSRSSRARSTTGTASSCSSGPGTHQLFSQRISRKLSSLTCLALYSWSSDSPCAKVQAVPLSQRSELLNFWHSTTFTGLLAPAPAAAESCTMMRTVITRLWSWWRKY